MPYKKIESCLIHLDDLIDSCGLFDGETDKNNGYGCRSRSKYKQESGCCFGFDCPLAITASLVQLKKYDMDLYKQYLPDFASQIKAGEKEDECDVSDFGGEWMVQYHELA